jgi:2-iminobutanoate/2-iminopropanoate deaminase
MKEIIFTEKAPQAIGPYSQAIATEAVVYTSGQLGIDVEQGKLSEGVENQTRCSMKNLGEILKSKGLTYENIVKTTIFLVDMEDFSVVNAVYASYFSGNYPARSCVQVAGLPLGGRVEIECVAVR